MPFNEKEWGRVSANNNTTFVVQSNGVHIREGSPAIFAYAAPEPLADIIADNYFAHQAVIASVCQGDLIYIDAIDGLGTYYVNTVNSLSDTITLLPLDTHLGTLTEITQASGIVCTPNPITTTGTIALANLGTPGVVPYPSSLTVDAQGRISAHTAGTQPITSLTQGNGIEITGSVPSLSIRASQTFCRMSIVESVGMMQSLPANGIVVGTDGTAINFNSTNSNTVIVCPDPTWHSNGLPSVVAPLPGVGPYKIRANITAYAGSLPTVAADGFITLAIGYPVVVQELYIIAPFCVSHANASLNDYLRTASFECILNDTLIGEGGLYFQLKAYIQDPGGAWQIRNAYFEVEALGP